MFRNYFKTAIRNLLRLKLFTGLNIFGLATGMTCSLLIILWVQDEISFDRFNKNAGKIYRITANVSGVEAAVVPPPLAAAVKAEIPAVKNATRIAALHKVITAGTKKFDEKNIYYADTNFLKIFNYPLLKGNVATVLSAPDAVVLTVATAVKYFGSTENAMGKTVYIDDDIKGRSMTVTGILKNVPPNSHLQFDMLLPIAMYDRLNNPDEAWSNFDAYVYFQVADNFKATPAALKKLEQQIDALRARNDRSGTKAALAIQPLTAIHLHSHFMLDVDGQGNGEYVTIFLLVAVFILLIACINFMNLSTALSSRRAKEVGLRKAIGAQRVQLIIQFMSESLLLSFVSLLVATGLAIVLLPLFNELASKAISINLLNIKIIVTLLITALLVGLVSGSYPALFLSSFNPVKVLKGIRIFQGRNAYLRNGLVVLQFAIAVILIISTLVVYTQLQFIKSRDMGFNKENLLYVHMPEVGDLHDHKEALKAALNQYPGITSFTITDNLPTYLTTGARITWPAMDPQEQVIGFRLRTNEDFIKTFGMRLVAGRFFEKGRVSDDSAYVVNETALKVMHLTPAAALGKKIGMNGLEAPIIGVVKDFNFKPIQHPVEPLVIRKNFAGGYVVLRTAPGNLQHTIAALKKVFEKVYGDYPFSYGFMNEDISKLYRAEQQMGRLFNVFAILAVIISCLGLFGLATFATQKRIREIGVRKVLGATEANIVAMLSKDFMKLVAAALVIAFPVAAWLMARWLEGFAYRIHMHGWMFLVAGLAALIIAFLTISYQSVKAAVTNPAKSLRTE
ncbi:MAG TPA: ABC transporter permease [Chitinophaga sp.]|nr:ABC transporter permease [Chitinophaga sp.]